MKNGINNLICVIVFLGIGVLFGLFIGGFIKGDMSLKFNEIRLIEIVQIATSVLVATIVTIVIANKLSFLIRKKELILELFDRFGGRINDIYKLGNNYIAKPSSETEKEIKALLKQAQILLTIILNIDSKIIKTIDEHRHRILDDFLEFKSALTDTPFGSKEVKYSKERRTKIDSLFGNILAKLFNCKISLYS